MVTFDFEDDAVGSVPAGWTDNSGLTGRIRVTDTDPISGTKSLRVIDGGGTSATGIANVGEEISSSFCTVRPIGKANNYQDFQLRFGLYRSSGGFCYIRLRGSNYDDKTLDVHFRSNNGTHLLERNAVVFGEEYQIGFDIGDTETAVYFDGRVYTIDSAPTGFDSFYVHSDDTVGLFDDISTDGQRAIRSELVFMSGEAIQLGSHGDHSYLFESGEAVYDGGTSGYVFESGSGLSTNL